MTNRKNMYMVYYMPPSENEPWLKIEGTESKSYHDALSKAYELNINRRGDGFYVVVNVE